MPKAPKALPIVYTLFDDTLWKQLGPLVEVAPRSTQPGGIRIEFGELPFPLWVTASQFRAQCAKCEKWMYPIRTRADTSDTRAPFVTGWFYSGVCEGKKDKKGKKGEKDCTKGTEVTAHLMRALSEIEVFGKLSFYCIRRAFTGGPWCGKPIPAHGHQDVDTADDYVRNKRDGYTCMWCLKELNKTLNSKKFKRR